MAKIQKTKIEIRPVTWAGETVLKYQGFATVVRPNGEKKEMTGDPMSTEEAALESLTCEMMQRMDDVSNALTALKDFEL